MGKEDKDKEKKDKDKKDKDKDKEKKDKDKKDKDKKDKDKKDKDKKDKKDKKEEKKGKLESEWALEVSKQLDNVIIAYQQIVKKFQDIDNYILRDSESKEDFIEKVRKNIQDLPEASQNVFIAFLDTLP